MAARRFSFECGRQWHPKGFPIDFRTLARLRRCRCSFAPGRFRHIRAWQLRSILTYMDRTARVRVVAVDLSGSGPSEKSCDVRVKSAMRRIPDSAPFAHQATVTAASAKTHRRSLLTVSSLLVLSDATAQLVERAAGRIVSVNSGGRWPRVEFIGGPALSSQRRAQWSVLCHAADFVCGPAELIAAN
jgi:hypothetical protein